MLMSLITFRSFIDYIETHCIIVREERFAQYYKIQSFYIKNEKMKFVGPRQLEDNTVDWYIQ